MKDVPQLDLHGKSKEDVFDLLDCFIRKNNDKEQALIIVGVGRGVIRNKALEYLKITGYSWAYQRVRGVENKGALVIDLY